MTRNVGALTLGFATWPCATMAVVATLRITSAQEVPKNFVLMDKPKPVAEIAFNDGDGHPRSLADFKRKVVLLNVWATWCVPCRKEMPALDRLQASLGGADFEVVPVSIDRGGLETIRKFYTETGIRNLAMYVDTSGQILRQVGAISLPTTLFVDRAGQEVGRVIGPAEWDAPEIAEFATCVVSRNNAAPSQESSKSTPAPPCGGRDPRLPVSGRGANPQP
jgi:thiol-disulfide isomerase/thioredoxin